MEKRQAKTAVLMVGPKGGAVKIVAHGGDVVATQGVPPGRITLREFIPFLVNEGDQLEFEGDCVPLVPGFSRVETMPYGQGSHETGANPSFKVTSADRMQRELARKIRALDQTSNAYERRLAQLETMEKRKKPTKEEEEDDFVVVDPVDVTSDDSVDPDSVGAGVGVDKPAPKKEAPKDVG